MYISYLLFFFRASLVAQMVKNLPAMQETQVRSLGREDPLEKEMATHFSNLAWRILWTEESGVLQSMGVTKSQSWLSVLPSPCDKIKISHPDISVPADGTKWNRGATVKLKVFAICGEKESPPVLRRETWIKTRRRRNTLRGCRRVRRRQGGACLPSGEGRCALWHHFLGPWTFMKVNELTQCLIGPSEGASLHLSW